MDSSRLQRAPSTSFSSNCQSKKEALAIQSRRAEFFASYKCQNFSLPDSIMFYLAKNPTSPEVYQKMIESCKYFFFKNPLLVVPQFNYSGGDKWQLSCGQRPHDLSNITSKLWITGPLEINKKLVSQNILSSILPKLYKCDAKSVTIVNQTISLHALSLLVSAAESIDLKGVTVKDEYSSNVAVEKVVEVAVKAKWIVLTSYSTLLNVTSETVKQLIKLSNFLKLSEFTMYGVSETFDLETFYSFMKQNKTTKIRLRFVDWLSEAYRNRLEEIVDEIIDTKIFDFKPPFLGFYGLDYEKDFMLNLFYYYL